MVATARTESSTDMTSRYRKPPEKRQPTSHRLPTSLVRKVSIIRDLWKARAEAEGLSEDDFEDINDTHVVSQLLSEAADAELAEFGGLPADEKALATMIAKIKAGKK